MQQKKGNRSKASKAKATLSDLTEQVESYKKRLERVTKALLKIEVSGYVEKKLKSFNVAVGSFAACNVLMCREQEPLWMEFAKNMLPDVEKVVADYVRERLQNAGDVDTGRMWMVDTCEDDHLASIAREYLQNDGRFGEIIETKAGCTIFSHCGPGTLGLLLMRK